MDPEGVTGEQPSPGVCYRFGGIVVDTAAHTLLRDGHPQAIEPKAFAVLLVLLQHADELVGRDQLLDTVWGHRHVTPGVLTRAIAQLRAALDDHPHEPRFIQTQHALGYRFIGDLAGPRAEPTAGETPAALVSEPPVVVLAALPPVAAPMATLPSENDDRHPAVPPRSRWRLGSPRTWFVATLALAVALLALAWVDQRGAPAGPTEASIAVLPFTSLSDNTDDRYFAEGLAVEMHDALAGIPGLQVASAGRRPTSGQPGSPDLKALGQQLGVATVLDASVRREGSRLRVNARLSDTATGFTLWSESYDREANDVFAVQREIASEVVQALPGVLPPTPRVLARLAPTNDLSAYEAYLKGQRQLRSPGEDEYLDKAIGFFGQALAADAGFARAQAGICRAEIIRFEGARDAPAFERAQKACEQAASMDPHLREVSLALGEMHRVRGEYAQANEQYTLALDDLGLRPSAYVGLARVQSEQGNNELALEYFDLARQLRPGDASIYRELGYHQYVNGSPSDAIESFRTATSLQPDDPSLWSSLGGLFLVEGDNVRAADGFQRSLAMKPSYGALSNLGTLRYAQGAYADAAGLYRRAAELDPTDFRIWGNIGDALAADPATTAQAREPYTHAHGWPGATSRSSPRTRRRRHCSGSTWPTWVMPLARGSTLAGPRRWQPSEARSRSSRRRRWHCSVTRRARASGWRPRAKRRSRPSGSRRHLPCDHCSIVLPWSGYTTAHGRTRYTGLHPAGVTGSIPMHMKLAALAGVFMLAGCSTSGPVRDGGPTADVEGDGVPCADSEGAPAVYIDVEYSGTSVSTPTPVCEVDWDTVITWRGEAGAEEFEIRFTGAGVGARGEPRMIISRPRVGRQKATLRAANNSGTYQYEILTATGGVDPAIIIRAR